MKNNIYKGYIASRNINKHPMPQRIQNMVIRNYAEKNGKTFSLSATEYIMENCFMMLKALANEAAHFEAITLFSLFLLPANKEERFEIYNSILDQNTEIHFAFEELAIKTKNDIFLIEDILLAQNLSQSIMESPWPYENL
jgi:sporadic carbohydrate cluster protein (TIGR04323 family)